MGDDESPFGEETNPEHRFLTSAGTGDDNVHDESMRFEENRLKSFATWPENGSIEVKKLARAGFYYLKKNLIVKCFRCKTIIDGWDFGHRAVWQHAMLNPHCEFVLRDVSTLEHRLNNNIIAKPLPTSLSSASSSSRLIANDPNSTVTTSTKSRRLQTLPIPLDAFYCESRIDKLDFGDYRKMWECKLLKLGVNEHKVPMYPKYATYESRISTFQTWPATIPQNPNTLAEADFYYIGIGDHVRCFFCSAVLRDWKQDDDPCVEHEKWFGKCRYLASAKSTGTQRLLVSPLRSRHRGVTGVPPPISGEGGADRSVRRANHKESREMTTGTSFDETSVALRREEEACAAFSDKRETRTCIICMDEEICVVLLPCGHFASCSKCLIILKDCPVCREPIIATVRAFLAV